MRNTNANDGSEKMTSQDSYYWLRGESRPATKEQQAELDKGEAEAQAKVDAMTQEEKDAYFNKIMGR